MNHDTGLQVYGIAGCQYSGTTLLSLLLGAHPGIFSTGEAHCSFQVYRRLLMISEVNYYCAMHYTECDFWTPEFRARCEHGDLDILYQAIRRYDPRKRIVLHSFQGQPIYAEMLRRSQPLHGLIVLFKRPVAYYSSTKVHLRYSASVACKEYADRYTKLLGFSNEQRIKVYPLYYEDLATGTEDCLRSLCRWLGLDFDPLMLEPWRVSERIHQIGGNTGVFMHMWDDPVRNSVLDSEYWKDTYSPTHRKWIEENYRTISLDDKWRSLPEDEIARVEAHDPSRKLFEQLLQMRSLYVPDSHAMP